MDRVVSVTVLSATLNHRGGAPGFRLRSTTGGRAESTGGTIEEQIP
ncbi:MAG: hypothetical protein PHX54_05340 [Lentimicrobiaceae bacterium]|nr:hypothetical protein [Lentimicrobiaceae bacterium]